ncbi:cysteine--tRNA ligase [bacterium]|nr:cysteine--tRNA ligase [bacterium]MBU1676549.1 cysteine--tRNA ligase [bacterium]
MTLHVYDHVARTRRKFEPIHPGRVGMYVCGMTVQDKPHVGHMFAFVACDMVRRYLEHLGYEVRHIQNFTDIDDKIIAKATEEGVDYRVVADRNIALYHEYAEALNIQPAHEYPLVTGHIPEIVAFIEGLVAKGHAYAAAGDVYFRVRSYDDYGFLSGRHVDDMRSGVRVEVGDNKEDPLDFALWKNAALGEPGWDSPWGRGRPGWHIECSVMSTKFLGNHFDFHGGGRDLLFPHHENECAQSCCGTGEQFVNYWLHNGLLFLGDKKMSKSDGNFFAMGDVLAKFRPEVIRFFLLNAHFRSQIDYSEERLREAEAALDRLVRGAVRLREKLASGVDPVPAGLVSEPGEILAKAVRNHRRRFFAAMDDDFNSAGAIGVLFGLVRDLNQYYSASGEQLVDVQCLEDAFGLFAAAAGILGLHRDGLAGLVAAGVTAIPDEILAMAAQRDAARARKDWAAADALRDEIQTRGFTVEDGASGTQVRPA